MSQVFTRGFRRSNVRINQTRLRNASSPTLEMLEGRVLMSVSAATLLGPLIRLGNQWTFDEVSTQSGTAVVTGSTNEKVAKHTTDPDNNLPALELDTTINNASNNPVGTEASYFAQTDAGLVSYGGRGTDIATGDTSVITDSPAELDLPNSLTQQVPFGGNQTFTETEVTTPPGGVARTPVVNTVQISGVLVSETPGPVTTALGVTYQTTFEVDITRTDTPQTTGIPDSPDTTREFFAPGTGIVLIKNADPSSTNETDLATFVPGTGKLDFVGTIPHSTTTAPLAPIVVHVEDTDGVLLSNDNSDVTLTISNPAGVTLGGTTTETAVGGVATFSDLTIATAGADYVLSATDGQLTGAASNVFAVTGPNGGGGGGGTGVTPAIVASTVPAAVVGGAKLHAAVKLNLSDATADKGYTVNVFASADGTLDGSDQLVTSLAKPTATLKAGKTVPVTIPITTLPAALPDGTYFLIVQTVDSSNNSSTTTTSGQVTVAAPFVTLTETVTTTLAPAIVSGQPAKGTVSLLITNTAGNVPSKGLTAINITASTVPGVLGTSIVIPFSKMLNIPVGKSVKVTVPVKNIPALADGDYFIVAQVTDPITGAISIGSSAATTNIAAPFITLAATLGPVVKIKSGDTLTLTNNGNVEDYGIFTATIGFSFDSAGAQPIGRSASAGKTFHIKAGKSIKVHSTDWAKITSGLAPGVPYFLTVSVTDAKGNNAFAVSTTSFTL